MLRRTLIYLMKSLKHFLSFSGNLITKFRMSASPQKIILPLFLLNWQRSVPRLLPEISKQNFSKLKLQKQLRLRQEALKILPDLLRLIIWSWIIFWIPMNMIQQKQTVPYSLSIPVIIKKKNGKSSVLIPWRMILSAVLLLIWLIRIFFHRRIPWLYILILSKNWIWKKWVLIWVL